MDFPDAARKPQRWLLVTVLFAASSLAVAEGFVFLHAAMWLLSMPLVVSVSVIAATIVVLGSVLSVVLIRRRVPNRQFQFSLRTMFLTLLVLCWSIARVTNEFRREILRDNAQNATIDELFKLGDKKIALGGREEMDRLPSPLVKLIGSRVTNDGALVFSEVIEVDLSGTSTSDEQLTALMELNGLAGLAVLDLSGTPVTDSGLGQLRHLTNLRTLSLKGTSVTAEGVDDLRRRLPSVSVEY